LGEATSYKSNFARAGIAMTLDRYSLWVPSISRATAHGMDEVLKGDEATNEALG
jgi:hypothetical protein